MVIWTKKNQEAQRMFPSLKTSIMLKIRCSDFNRICISQQLASLDRGGETHRERKRIIMRKMSKALEPFWQGKAQHRQFPQRILICHRRCVGTQRRHCKKEKRQ